MGGYGSGRPGRRPVNDQSLALPFDRTFHRALAELRRAGSGIWFHVITWTIAGRQIATTGVYIIVQHNGDATMVLSYAADGEAIREVVAITWTPTPFGRRPWWRCPCCGRRCARIYNPHGPRWRCGRCCHITYTSSNESDKRLAYGRIWGALDLRDLDTQPTSALILALRGHRRVEDRWRRVERQARTGKPGRPRKR
jgi:hypothetical protein